jgi:hypothetical protein
MYFQGTLQIKSTFWFDCITSYLLIIFYFKDSGEATEGAGHRGWEGPAANT